MIRTKWADRLLVALCLSPLPVPGHAAGWMPGDILYADSTNQRILAVDPVTGDRDVLRDSSVGSGPDFAQPSGVAFDPVAFEIYVTDTSLDAVFAVEPATGNRRIVSSNFVCIGPDLGYPTDILVDASDGTLIVADWGVYAASGATNPPYLLRVDPVTGDRKILSSGSVGSGPALAWFGGLAFEPGGALLMGQAQTEAVLRVDPAKGDRMTVSQFGVVGTGPALDGLVAMALGSNIDAFAIDRGPTAAVVRIDLASGDRTVISDSKHGTGPSFANPLAATYDASRQRVLVADNFQAGGAALLAVDPTTGDRTVVSGAGTGLGSSLGTSFGIVITPEPSADLLVLVAAGAIESLRRRRLATSAGRSTTPKTCS